MNEEHFNNCNFAACAHARRLLAVPALHGHRAGQGMGHNQAWISLQACFAMAFRTGSHTGVTSYTLSVVGNDKAVHRTILVFMKYRARRELQLPHNLERCGFAAILRIVASPQSSGPRNMLRGSYPKAKQAL